MYHVIKVKLRGELILSWKNFFFFLFFLFFFNDTATTEIYTLSLHDALPISPLRDIPQSIQVVPRQVIEDRNTRTVIESVETVSGVVYNGGFADAPTGGLIIRGFSQPQQFRNGFRDTDRGGLTGIGTVESIEVLKGPASVLFGTVEPGGIVNVITRQPLSDPQYQLSFELGNRSYYQPGIDFTGPLTSNDSVLYRLIANYESTDGFQEFTSREVTTLAPTLAFNIGENTDLSFYYEYINYLEIGRAHV